MDLGNELHSATKKMTNATLRKDIEVAISRSLAEKGWVYVNRIRSLSEMTSKDGYETHHRVRPKGYFKPWLRDQMERTDRVGEFANGAYFDPFFPDYGTYSGYYSYLKTRVGGVLNTEMEANFTAAWNEFAATLKG